MLEAKPAGNGAARWQRRAVYAQPARNFDSSGNGPRQWPQTSDPLTPALGTGTRSASTWRGLDAWCIGTGSPQFDLGEQLESDGRNFTGDADDTAYLRQAAPPQHTLKPSPPRH